MLVSRFRLPAPAVAVQALLHAAPAPVWLRLPGNRLERVDALGRLTAARWVWLADNPASAPYTALPAGVWADTGADGLGRSAPRRFDAGPVDVRPVVGTDGEAPGAGPGGSSPCGTRRLEGRSGNARKWHLGECPIRQIFLCIALI